MTKTTSTMDKSIVTGNHFNLAAECNLRIADMHYQLYLAIACLSIFVLVLVVVMTVPLYMAMDVGKDSRDKHFTDRKNTQ